MKDHTLSDSFYICQDAQGAALELPGAEGEIVCIAFDLKSLQLVELHVVVASDEWTSEIFQSFYERLNLLGSNRDAALPRLLKSGKLDGLAFYSIALEDGESLVDYSFRNNGFSERETIRLIHALIQKLLEFQSFTRLFRATSLSRAILVNPVQSFHRERFIQIRTLGLNLPETRVTDDMAEKRITQEIGQLLYQMLTGQESPVKGGAIPESVRLLDRHKELRQFVTNSFTHESGPPSLEELNRIFGNISENLMPNSGDASRPTELETPWVRQIFGGMRPENLYPIQFDLLQTPTSLRQSSSLQALDKSTGGKVTLLPLPNRKILPQPPFSSTPDGLRDLEIEKAENLLFPQATWHSDSFSFHVETNGIALSLKDYLKSSPQLSAEDMVIVLREIDSGMRQADELKIKLPSLETEAVQLTFPADFTPEKIQAQLAKPLAEWESVQIRLRTHASLSSILNPWPIGLDLEKPDKARVSETFLLIAIELAGGLEEFQRRKKSSTQAFPPLFSEYLDQQLITLKKKDPLPEPWALLRTLTQRAGVKESRSSVQIPKDLVVANAASEPPQDVCVQHEPLSSPQTFAPEITPLDEDGISSQDVDTENVDLDLNATIEIPQTALIAAPQAVGVSIDAEVEPAKIAAQETIEPDFHQSFIESSSSSPTSVETFAPEASLAVDSKASAAPPAGNSFVFSAFQEIEPSATNHPFGTPPSEALFAPPEFENVEVANIAPFPVEELPQPADVEVVDLQPPVLAESAPTVPAAALKESESTPILTFIPPAPSSSLPASMPLVISALDETELDDNNRMSEEIAPSDDDFGGAPTLLVDLNRLTTSDSLFSRRSRTITIRNR